MPYKFVTEFGELKPLAPDNHKSEHGLEDQKILRSGNKWVKDFKKRGIDASVEHYEE